MTTERLRDLLEERVGDVEADDLSARAWARADGVRRRRRTVVDGTAARCWSSRPRGQGPTRRQPPTGG
jgi:hypothetical protein